MDDALRISRAIHTLSEMIEDRMRCRVSVIEEDTINASTKQLKEVAYSDIELASTMPVFSFKVDADGEALVVFNMSSKFRVIDIKRHLSTISGEGTSARRLFVVYSDKPTKSVATTTSLLAADVQLFDIAMLQFNSYRQPIVPPHRVITQSEISKLSQTYSISSRSALPQILSSDPVCRYLNIRPGEMLEIRRASVSAIEAVAYRICV